MLDTFAGARQCLNSIIPLVDFGAADIELLRQHCELMETWADDVVETFYSALYADATTEAVFHPSERPEREASLRQWYRRVVTDEITEQYWAWQWAVGRSHAHRIGADPMAVAMLSAISEVVRVRAITTLGTTEGGRLHRSFCKLAAIIVSLITEGYASAGRSYKDTVAIATARTR